jgi:hypothetical protein
VQDGDKGRAIRIDLVCGFRPAVCDCVDLAQQEDLLTEVAFLDEGSRPHRLQEFVLRDDPRPLLDEQQQYVERLRRQSLRNSVAEQ